MIEVLGKEPSGGKSREALEQHRKEEKPLCRGDTEEAPSRGLKAELVPPALHRRCHHTSISPGRMDKPPTIFMYFPKPKGFACATTKNWNGTTVPVAMTEQSDYKGSSLSFSYKNKIEASQKK